MDIIRKRPEDLSKLRNSTAEELNLGDLAEKLGIKVLTLGENKATLAMPVESNTQPAGILSGGATAALAETSASLLANFYAQSINKLAIGLELNISHLATPKTELVMAEVTPIRVGSKICVHDILICDQSGKIISKARATNFLIKSN